MEFLLLRTKFNFIIQRRRLWGCGCNKIHRRSTRIYKKETRFSGTFFYSALACKVSPVSSLGWKTHIRSSMSSAPRPVSSKWTESCSVKEPKVEGLTGECAACTPPWARYHRELSGSQPASFCHTSLGLQRERERERGCVIMSHQQTTQMNHKHRIKVSGSGSMKDSVSAKYVHVYVKKTVLICIYGKKKPLKLSKCLKTILERLIVQQNKSCIRPAHEASSQKQLQL